MIQSHTKPLRQVFRALLCGFALSACATAHSSETAPATETAKVETTAPENSALAKDRKIVADIVAQVEKLRGLPAKQPVEMTPLTADVLDMLIKRETEARYTKEQIQGSEDVLKHLGLIPRDMDLMKFLRALYQEQVAGLYDDETKKLYVSEKMNLSGTVAKSILAHEICHALQDQHYSLTSSPIKLKDNDDRALAYLSVVEGDATLLMSDYLANNLSWRLLFELPGMFMMDQSQLESAPNYLSASLIFPYMQGLEFVTNAYKYAQAEDLPDEEISEKSKGKMVLNRVRNRLLSQPPESTEQIIHPNKYAARSLDKPTNIALDSVTSSGLLPAKNRYANVSGEFGMKIMLREKLPRRDADAAAAGWDGDRYAWGGDLDGDYGFAWYSAWDTSEDARAAAEALVRYFKAQRPGLSEIEADSDDEATWLKDDRGYAAVSVNGGYVAVAHSNNQDMAAKILEALNGIEVEAVP